MQLHGFPGFGSFGFSLIRNSLTDGTLPVIIRPTVDAAFTKPLPAQLPLQSGQVKIGSNQVELVALGLAALPPK